MLQIAFCHRIMWTFNFRSCDMFLLPWVLFFILFPVTPMHLLCAGWENWVVFLSFFISYYSSFFFIFFFPLSSSLVWVSFFILFFIFFTCINERSHRKTKNWRLWNFWSCTCFGLVWYWYLQKGVPAGSGITWETVNEVIISEKYCFTMCPFMMFAELRRFKRRWYLVGRESWRTLRNSIMFFG